MARSSRWGWADPRAATGAGGRWTAALSPSHVASTAATRRGRQP
jgi:hypothetical protein